MTDDRNQDFTNINFSDAQVTTLSLSQEGLHLYYTDWQEVQRRLIFSDVAAVELFNILGEALSHGTADVTTAFTARAETILSENLKGYYCFTLWSAWTNQPVIQIVAERFQVA